MPLQQRVAIGHWLVLCFLCSQLPPDKAQYCPAPFSFEAGRCVFVNTSQSFNWCSANRQCASIGGELINSYNTLRLLTNLPWFSSSVWVGVSDLADERNQSRVGWQRILDRGLLPLDDSLWYPGDPNNLESNQDCVGNSINGFSLSDFFCTSLRGLACEFTGELTLTAAPWQRTEFKRTSYNASTDYCYTDLPQVRNAMHCVAAAQRIGSSSHVLYNRRLKLCRLLQFTDAQVEEAIETSADWVKYSITMGRSQLNALTL